MDSAVVTILLIDDSEDDAVLVQDLLSEVKGCRYHFDWVSSYEEGLSALRSDRHDLCLLDYRLGRQDGLELLREVRAGGRNGPVIFLTGHGSYDVDLEAMKSGATEYLDKAGLTSALLERTLRYAIERHRTEQKLAQLAKYDSLTGLPNRALFQERLAQALALSGRESHQVALLFFDLDRFKVVNDTFGHFAGDLLLKEVARKLRATLRQSDLIARLGGDEFVVLLPEISSPSTPVRVSQKILNLFSRPFVLDGQEVFAATSIGISLYPHDASDPHGLIKCADRAMYNAKEQGGNACKFFSVSMDLEVKERLDLETLLHHAVEREEFDVLFQTQIDLQSRRIIGAEAQLCWQAPSGELLLADRIVPLLEESGLILPAREWSLRRVCRQINDWSAAGLSSLRISVNLSVRQLKQPGLVGLIDGILYDAGLPGSCLELEITEGNLGGEGQDTESVLQELHGLGIGLVLDQFGSVGAPLRQLRRYPIEKLKIGSPFVAGVDQSPTDQAIVRGIIALAHSLKIQVVAVGVETEAECDWLRQNGCDAAQGAYFGGNFTAEALTQMLATGTAL